MSKLEQLLADWREDAAVLDRNGHEADARRRREQADQVFHAAEPWLRFLTEDEAVLKSGRSARWLRRRAKHEWEAADMARRVDGRWIYRFCVVPQQLHLSQVREDARRQARAVGRGRKVA